LYTGTYHLRSPVNKKLEEENIVKHNIEQRRKGGEGKILIPVPVHRKNS
jgi:hypothetical protein